jgi:hypothetical protein
MIDIDRNRRYARLMTLAKKPDDSMIAYLWISASRWETYIGAMRYLKQNNLSVSEPAVNLHLHNVAREL